jgi:hypothetical protein
MHFYQIAQNQTAGDLMDVENAQRGFAKERGAARRLLG